MADPHQIMILARRAPDGQTIVETLLYELRSGFAGRAHAESFGFNHWLSRPFAGQRIASFR
jgi:hypothetical protein